MPLTPEQRQIMIDEMAAKRMQDFIDWQDQQGDEYHNRVKIFRTHYKGNIIIPAESGFHPMFFKGTEKEYDLVIEKYFSGKEDVFKIIGHDVYNTIEEYESVWGLDKIK
jgi:hypothetical protein